jgi:hypothetical protein
MHRYIYMTKRAAELKQRLHCHITDGDAHTTPPKKEAAYAKVQGAAPQVHGSRGHCGPRTT